MKDKILALINAPTDIEIKVELLEEYMKVCCEEYIVFNVERNDLLVGALGLDGFMDDILSVNKRELWERFKDYLNEKYKIHIV